MNQTEYLLEILKARVYDLAKETPLEFVPGLSQKYGSKILLKREDLQPVFSFKLRGAYNRIVRLTQEERERGVIAASAGNHAQGVAMSAKHLSIKALIVMPRTTPAIKVSAVRRLGAKAVLHGDAYDEAYQHALGLAQEKGFTFIHPYDDPYVIAGQGTVGMEIVRQFPHDLHAVFVPVGGGGLIAGVATCFKLLRPDVKIIGVEPEDAPTLYSALKAQKRVVLDQVGIFADGVAVKQIGEETFRLARQYVDEVVLVKTDEICAAVKDIFDATRCIAEPAGALGIAGVKRYLSTRGVKDQTVVAINSGANMNFDRLRYVTERAEVGEQREALLAVTIPEKPGSFRAFCKDMGGRSVTEFNYRFSDVSQAHIFVGVHLEQGETEKTSLIEQLQEKGYPVLDLTHNEMAKLHVRHMVGGHGHAVQNEKLFRFEFPERPGALQKFLNLLGQSWNISMFHYRNHGAAYGRVLVGLQVPSSREEKKKLEAFLQELGYAYWEETNNPVYGLFLK